MNRTAQREAILSELRSRKTHPTADELYASLRTTMPQISLGTVYRNLEQLSQAGVIRKLETAGKQRRFDGELAEHFHFRCEHCGCVTDIADRELSAAAARIAELLPRLGGDRFHLELGGICGKCRSDAHAGSPYHKKEEDLS